MVLDGVVAVREMFPEHTTKPNGDLCLNSITTFMTTMDGNRDLQHIWMRGDHMRLWQRECVQKLKLDFISNQVPLEVCNLSLLVTREVMEWFCPASVVDRMLWHSANVAR